MSPAILLLASALDVAALADVLCAEGRGLPRAELLAIAQTAKNRARGGSLRAELATPGAWAHGCPRQVLRPYTRLAAAFLAGRARAPRWARRSVAFVAPRALHRVRARWSRRLVPIQGTRTVHTFWRPRAARR